MILILQGVHYFCAGEMSVTYFHARSNIPSGPAVSFGVHDACKDRGGGGSVRGRSMTLRY